MRISYSIAIGAVVLVTGTGLVLAGPDYPNNAPAAQPQTLTTHQVRETSRLLVAPVTAVYPNNAPASQPSVAVPGRDAPIVPIAVTYPNNAPQG